MGKTWIVVAQAVVFGGLALFSLIFGPLFLYGFMRKADGTPGTDAGIALIAMSVPLLLIFVLAVYDLRARQRPLLRLCREGIEIALIGPSSLDGVPLIPGLIRVAWLIVSTEGFRRKVARVPWSCFQDAQVSGLPMARHLTIVALPFRADEWHLPLGSVSVEYVALGEAAFSAPLDVIAESIRHHARYSTASSYLPSWYDTGATDA